MGGSALERDLKRLVGERESDAIIAVDYDRQAPIFEAAACGIGGDVLQVVPAITSYIRELRGQQ